MTVDFALRARCALAQSRIAAPLNEELAEDFEIAAVGSAHSHGMYDSTPSALIAGEPLLMKAFRDGREELLLMQEMAARQQPTVSAMVCE